MSDPLRIGVLAVQGNFREPRGRSAPSRPEAVEVRLPEQLDGLDGLIVPGGESTAMTRLMHLYGLRRGAAPVRAADLRYLRRHDPARPRPSRDRGHQHAAQRVRPPGRELRDRLESDTGESRATPVFIPCAVIETQASVEVLAVSDVEVGLEARDLAAERVAPRADVRDPEMVRGRAGSCREVPKIAARTGGSASSSPYR